MASADTPSTARKLSRTAEAIWKHVQQGGYEPVVCPTTGVNINSVWDPELSGEMEPNSWGDYYEVFDYYYIPALTAKSTLIVSVFTVDEKRREGTIFPPGKYIPYNE